MRPRAWVVYGTEKVPEALVGESDGGTLFWMVSLDNKEGGKMAKVRALGPLDTAGQT